MPTGIAENAERRQRFEREAKTISSPKTSLIAAILSTQHRRFRPCSP